MGRLGVMGCLGVDYQYMLENCPVTCDLCHLKKQKPPQDDDDDHDDSADGDHARRADL